MRYIVLIILLTTLILTISLVTNDSKAETATSGNLLPNAGAGTSNSQNSTDSYTPDKVGTGQTGWTFNGINQFTNEFEAKGQGTVSADGTLLGITTTKQNGGSHTTTTDSLDGGVRLDGVTEIQNCEWTSSSYRCGSASSGGGARDTFSTTIKITDANDNVLGITTFTRNNDAGYGNNSFTYTDSITHTGTGARNYEWEWQGTDGSDTNNQGLIGPNLLGASLTATLLDIDYTAITEETQAELDLTNELLEEAQEDLTEKLKELEEINLEQLTEIETLEFVPELKELEIEEINLQELKIEELETMFVQNFKEVLVKENLTEEFETALIEENITEEEFFEEVGNMMKEELNIQEAPKETKMEESNVITEKPMEEETIKEEKIEETNTEETNANNPNSNETTQSTNTEAVEENETSSEKPMESEESTEETTSESSVGEDKETERETETETNEEGVDADETGNTQEANVNAGVEKDVSGSISAKVEKIIKKLEQTLMSVDQKVRAVQFITLKAMNDSGPSLNNYANKSFYSSKQLPDGNIDFFNQLNIEQQQIYTDITLAEYTDNDPLSTRRVELDRIKTEENRLLLEIQQLREQL